MSARPPSRNPWSRRRGQAGRGRGPGDPQAVLQGAAGLLRRPHPRGAGHGRPLGPWAGQRDEAQVHPQRASAGGWWPRGGCTRTGSGSWSCRLNAHQGRASSRRRDAGVPGRAGRRPVRRAADQDRPGLIRREPPGTGRGLAERRNPMGRLFALMTGLFPRLALFILWVARLTRIDAASDTFRLPLLGHHPAVRDPDVRAALHPRPGPVRMGLVLGRHRRPPRHRALGRRRHPAKPEGTPGQAVSPWSRTPTVTRCMPVPPMAKATGASAPASGLPAHYLMSASQGRRARPSRTAPNSSRPSAARGGCSPGSWSLGAVAATQDARLAAVHPLWVMPVPPHVGRLAGGGLSAGLCVLGGST